MGDFRSLLGARWLLFTLISGAVLMAGLHSAEAHAMLVSAEPDAGATLQAAPAAITLTFSEPIGADSIIRVIGEQFRPIATLSTAVKPAPNVLTLALPELSAGVYTVEYDTLSIDGHTIRGAYEFAIEAEQGFLGRLSWQSIVLGIVISIAIRFLPRLTRSRA